MGWNEALAREGAIGWSWGTDEGCTPRIDHAGPTFPPNNNKKNNNAEIETERPALVGPTRCGIFAFRWGPRRPPCLMVSWTRVDYPSPREILLLCHTLTLSMLRWTDDEGWWSHDLHLSYGPHHAHHLQLIHRRIHSFSQLIFSIIFLVSPNWSKLVRYTSTLATTILITET